MHYATLLFFTLILAASFAQAQEVPKRKSGLWEIKRMSTRTDDTTPGGRLEILNVNGGALLG